MEFIRGVGARIQIWPTIVHVFLLASKFVTAVVGGIYTCLLFSCSQLENYLLKLTSTSVEHVPASPTLFLHDDCLQILERTCFLKFRIIHFSKECDPIVTRRQFNVRLLYFVVFLSQEMKINDYAFHDMPASKRDYFKDLKTIRRHCQTWLQSSVHSFESFVLLHICMHFVHIFIPITVDRIENIEKTIINAFLISRSEYNNYCTKRISVRLANGNPCSDGGNLRQSSGIKVKSILCNETRSINFSQDNLPKSIGIDEPTDEFKNDFGNLSGKENCTKEKSSPSPHHNFEVMTVLEDRPENIFDGNEKSVHIKIEGEHLLKGTSPVAFNHVKVSDALPKIIYGENKSVTKVKTHNEKPDAEYYIQDVDKITEVSKNIFNNAELIYPRNEIVSVKLKEVISTPKYSETKPNTNRHKIKHSSESSVAGSNVIPYYDWELPVDDEINIDDEELLSTNYNKIQEPKLATTVYDLTVGFGTLPDRLKNMLRTKYPHWPDRSGVVAKFPVLTPQEILEDKGQQLVFLNWWHHFFSKIAATSKTSIEDAFSHFLKREADSKLKIQIEKTPIQDEKCASNVHAYPQEEFKKALMYEDVRIAPIPAISLTVKETLNIPYQNEAYEDCCTEVNVNILLSNLRNLKLWKEKSHKSMTVENATIGNSNRQKQTVIFNSVDPSEQDPSAMEVKFLLHNETRSINFSQDNLPKLIGIGEPADVFENDYWNFSGKENCTKEESSTSPHYEFGVTTIPEDLSEYTFDNEKSAHIKIENDYFWKGTSPGDFNHAKVSEASPKIIYGENKSVTKDTTHHEKPDYEHSIQDDYKIIEVPEDILHNEELIYPRNDTVSVNIKEEINTPKYSVKNSETKPDTNRYKIKYPSESSVSGCNLIPYYDWELPVEDGKDIGDGKLLRTNDDTIQKPKLATTIHHLTVGFGTLPDRLKNIIRTKHPNWPDRSCVVAKFPVLTPQEILEDKGKQLVFLNWWDLFLSKFAGTSKPSIEDAFSHFLKREAGLKLKKQIEKTSKQDENCASNVHPYHQEEFKKALIGEDVRIAPIPDISSTVKAKETLSIPYQNEAYGDRCSEIDVNVLLSNLKNLKLWKKIIVENSSIGNRQSNRQKLTEICINIDPPKQEPSANDHYKKKKSRASRKKNSRKKHKNTTHENDESLVEITKVGDDDKEDCNPICNKADNDLQKQKTSQEIKSITEAHTVVDDISKENIQKEVTFEKCNTQIPKQMVIDEPINNLPNNFTFDKEINITEANNKVIDNAKKQVKIYKTAKGGKMASNVDESIKKDKERAVEIIEENKCNQNEIAGNSSVLNSTKKIKNDLNESDNSILKDKRPVLPKPEMTLLHVSEEIRPNSKKQTSQDNTPIIVKEFQKQSNSIVNNQNVNEFDQSFQSKGAGNTSIELKIKKARKLRFESFKGLEATCSISQLNQDMENKPFSNSEPIKSRYIGFPSSLSTVTCPDAQKQSVVCTQKIPELFSKKPDTFKSYQSILEPPHTSPLETTKDVKTEEETTIFKLYSDVVKQEKSRPDNSSINRIENKQLVSFKLPQPTRKIHSTVPSTAASVISTAISVHSSDKISSDCSIVTAASLYPSDTTSSFNNAFSLCLTDTTTSMRSSDTSSMYAVSTTSVDSLMCPIAITLSTCTVTTSASISPTNTTKSTFSNDPATTMNVSDITSSMSSISTATSTYLFDNTLLISSSTKMPPMYPGETAESTNPIDITSSICPTDTTVSTCLNNQTTSSFSSTTASSIFLADTITSICSSVTASSTTPGCTHPSTDSNAKATSTSFTTSTSITVNPTFASPCPSLINAPSVHNPVVVSTCYGSISSGKSLTQSFQNSSLGHEKHLPAKGRRSPDQRQGLTVAQRLAASFLKNNREPVQNETQAKDLRAITEETPANLVDNPAPKQSIGSADSQNGQTFDELLKRYSIPNYDDPSTQIAQGEALSESQTKELCADLPNDQVSQETPKSGANPHENSSSKVPKNLLLTDSESDSSESSESQSPVTKYKFAAVRQKLRSDIAEKLTEIMRKQVRRNSETKREE